VDEMLKMIENNSRWSMALVYAVLEIKGLSSSELNFRSMKWANKP